MPIEVSNAHAPIIITTASGELTDKEYAEYLAKYHAITTDKGRPYALAFDATHVRSMAPGSRQLQANAIKDRNSLIKKLNCGCAFVVGSAWHRTLLGAIHWLSPPPYEHVFATRAPKRSIGVSSSCAPEKSRCPPTSTPFAAGGLSQDVPRSA